jgi:hypothetical protein
LPFIIQRSVRWNFEKMWWLTTCNHHNI